MRTRAAGLVVAAVVLAAGTACGSESPPAERVPALGSQLEAVEDAVADGDYHQVRAVLERMVARAARAELAGTITSDQAEEIRRAARDVVAALPDAP